MPKLLKLSLVSWLVLVAFGMNSLSAQDAIFNIFNNIVRASAFNEAKKAWSRLPSNLIACMDAEFEQQGVSVDRLVQNGVRPNDPSLASVRRDCEAEINQASEVTEADGSSRLSEKPTYDCSKAKSATGRIICQDPQGASADWKMVSSSWAARFSLPPSSRKSFDDDEQRWLVSLNRRCSLDAGQITFSTVQRQCVLRSYATRTAQYLNRLNGDALAEAALSPEDHAQIQESLISLGFLVGDADGEFGADTRAAIRKFHEHSKSGDAEFLTAAERERLLKGISEGQSPSECIVADPTDTSFNVRSAPDGDVTATLSNGTKLLILQVTKGSGGQEWALVQKLGDANPLGWAFRRYINCGPIKHEQTTADAKASQDTPQLRQAREFLEDARAFIKLQTAVPNISEIATEAANLQSAIDNSAVPNAVTAQTKLSELLKPIAGFERYAAAAQQLRVERAAAEIAHAKETLSTYALFIDSYLASHLGDARTTNLIKIRQEVQIALDSSSFESIQKAITGATNYIAANGLSQEYASLVAASEPKTTKPISETLGITAKSQFVLDGPNDQIVLLYNVSPTAPNIWKNVRGDIQFQNDTASLCFAQQRPDLPIVRYVEHLLRQDGARNLNSQAAPCTLASVPKSIDVVAIVRGDFVKADAGYGSQLIELINSDVLRKYKAVSDFPSVAQARRELSAQIATELDVGSRDGFGVIVLTDSNFACVLVTPEFEKSDGLKELLKENREVIAPKLESEWQFIRTTVDSAFLNLQRRECGYVVGPSEGLRQITLALKRDGVLQFSFAPVWWNEKDLDRAYFDVRDAQEQASRKQAEANRAAQEQAALQKIRLENDKTRSSDLEKKLRDENGVKARGLLHSIDDDIKKLADQRDNKSAFDFASYSNWLGLRFASNWETYNVSSAIEDYGTVRWGNRTLNGILVKSVVQQKNRELGKYEDTCYLFGGVEDLEFQMWRDSIAVDCNDTGAINNWKSKEQFKSEWNVD